LQVSEFRKAAEILAAELLVVAEVEAHEVFGVSDAIGEVGSGVGARDLFAEGGFVSGHGHFELSGFGEPVTLLAPLVVDGFGE
jgi:hypothetical protein